MKTAQYSSSSWRKPGLIGISVSRSSPHWFAGPTLSEFAPSRRNLQAWQNADIDDATYQQRYAAQLDKINWPNMMRRIRNIERSANAEAVFLCWCTLTNSARGWCHREQLAAYAKLAWNTQIEELDMRPRNPQIELFPEH